MRFGVLDDAVEGFERVVEGDPFERRGFPKDRSVECAHPLPRSVRAQVEHHRRQVSEIGPRRAAIETRGGLEDRKEQGGVDLPREWLVLFFVLLRLRPRPRPRPRLLPVARAARQTLRRKAAVPRASSTATPSWARASRMACANGSSFTTTRPGSAGGIASRPIISMAGEADGCSIA